MVSRYRYFLALPLVHPKSCGVGLLGKARPVSDGKPFGRAVANSASIGSGPGTKDALVRTPRVERFVSRDTRKFFMEN